MKDVLTALFSTRHTKQEVQDTLPVVDDILACTGKLPLYADFLRSNLNTAEAIALDKWLQSGFQFLSQRRRSTFKEVFNRFPKLEFIMFGDKTMRPVTGVVIPGKDQSGREYPFVIFKVLGLPIKKNQVPLLPTMLNNFRRLAMELSQENWMDLDKDLLFRRIDSLPTNEFEAGQDYLSNQARSELEVLSSRSLWETILPVSSLEERVEFIKIFNNKIQSIIALPAQSRKWGIEINIFNSRKRAMVQHFFVSLVVRMLGEGRWNGQSWMSEFSEGKSRLTLFFRPVIDEDFLTLVDYEAGRNNLIVINDLLQECEFSTHSRANTNKSISTNMADLMNDWMALFDKEKYQSKPV